ncbi:MAG: ABC transporter permease [Cyanobacteria bacterium QH_8_48_120]|nr:MAG: ABC transporter permease [Cyanobacteria bacterium QH_8_48_120]PSO87882.1 MAG: ABC transporter permease [Cyanobacteria bacterium QH_9_48_43]
MSSSVTTKQRRSQAKRYWELLRVLVEQNLKGRYRGSFLGVFWSLLNPLFMTGIYTLVLGAAFATYYDDSIVNYVLAAFTGLATFHFFAGSTSQALRSVVSGGALLNKIRLPVSVFPASMIAANVFQFAIAVLPLLALMALIISGSPVNSIALLLPLSALFLVSTGTGFILSALYVFFRDLSYFYQVAVYGLRITTPVFYPIEIVPEKIQPFLLLNPLAQIIQSVRQIVLSGEAPNLELIWVALLSGVIVCGLGWFCFDRLRHHFMDLL